MKENLRTLARIWDRIWKINLVREAPTISAAANWRGSRPLPGDDERECQGDIAKRPDAAEGVGASGSRLSC